MGRHVFSRPFKCIGDRSDSVSVSAICDGNFCFIRCGEINANRSFAGLDRSKRLEINLFDWSNRSDNFNRDAGNRHDVDICTNRFSSNSVDAGIYGNFRLFDFA